MKIFKRSSIVWAVTLSAGLGGSGAAAQANRYDADMAALRPEVDPVVVPSVPLRPSWPDPLLVHEWLARENLLARRAWQQTSIEAGLMSTPLRPLGSTVHEARPEPTRASRPRPKDVELAAVYGTDNRWSAEVRIGGVIHRLHPRPDAAGATDGKGVDSILAERFDGKCVQLIYRKSRRKACLKDGPHVARERDDT